MQKLEEVLRAEEAARHAVSDARERAAVTVRDAEAEARRTIADEREAAAEQAAGVRDRAIATAMQQAAEIGIASGAALKSTGETARGRIPQAVQVALDELLG